MGGKEQIRLGREIHPKRDRALLWSWKDTSLPAGAEFPG